MLMPPGHPIILLKSNYCNMAPVSVRRSILSLVEILTSISAFGYVNIKQ